MLYVLLFSNKQTAFAGVWRSWGGPAWLPSNFWCCCIWQFDPLQSSRWLPCRSGCNRREVAFGRPAVEPPKGGGTTSEEKSIQGQFLLHSQPSRHRSKKRLQNPLEQIFTVKSIIETSGWLHKLILHYVLWNIETLNRRCSKQAIIS